MGMCPVCFWDEATFFTFGCEETNTEISSSPDSGNIITHKALDTCVWDTTEIFTAPTGVWMPDIPMWGYPWTTPDHATHHWTLPSRPANEFNMAARVDSLAYKVSKADWRLDVTSSADYKWPL